MANCDKRMRTNKTMARMEERVVRLKSDFSKCIEHFDNAQLFTGPSLYFHFRTLEIRKECETAIDTIDDERFFEYLYATLTSWGMHRMGAGNTKLREIKEIETSFKSQIDSIRYLQTLNLVELEASRIEDVTELLWNLIANLRVGVGSTKIVANSKALHHLLPSLLPPIDREYTLRFFYNHKTLNQGDEVAFREIYPRFHEIATSQRKLIQKFIGLGMHTSESKVIDNAIVGFVLRHLS